MYNLPYYKANHPDDVLDFMKAHPFITLCGADENGSPVATHVPVMFEQRDGKLFLQAHIQRKTNHHKAFEQNPQVLAIFSGAHSYVSASWYSNPAVGSTWNYQAVHASGVLRFGTENELRQLLQKLTAHFENNRDSPSSFHHLSEDYVTTMVKAIIVFEIELTDIQHVFKLSQNRDDASKENIIKHLDESDSTNANAVALAMKNQFKKL